jgi:hypothetical protein
VRKKLQLKTERHREGYVIAASEGPKLARLFGKYGIDKWVRELRELRELSSEDPEPSSGAQHPKNSLFYKTTNGAEVGDLFMSLIYTCELNGINPFDYLTELQKHAQELAKNPAAWMPWNYRQTLLQATTSQDPA